MNHTMEEFYLEKMGETDNAFKFTDGVSQIWLPKSQVEVEHVKGMDFKVMVPLWLAKAKEML